MAAHALRLRRSLTLSSSIPNHHRIFSSSLPSIAAPPLSVPCATKQIHSLIDVARSIPDNISFQFMFTRTMSSRPRYNNDNNMDGDQISPDAILFEGCDYNHWLITMDFPKDPAPTPEEMVETYVQTAAKVLGSVEEAKKKIYACSTTTYHGFQVEVSEEVSEKFNGLPGVVFVLPDSYIDPVNKEYGGDKYINGTIIPRPPPVQFGKHRGRYNDRNRDYNRPPPRGQMEGSPPPQGNYGDRMPMNNTSGGQGNYQGDRRGPMPSYQGNYNQGGRGNLSPPGQTGFPQRDQRSYANPEQRDFRGDGRTFAPPQMGSYRQGTGGNYGRGTGEHFGQGGPASYGQGTGGQFGQGGPAGYRQGTGGQFGQGGPAGYGQGTGEQFGQGGPAGYGQGTGGQFGQGGGASYGQGPAGQSGQGTGGQYGEGGGASHQQGRGGQYGQGVGGYGLGESRNFGDGQNPSQYGGELSSQPGQQGSYEFMRRAGDDQGRY